MSFSRRAIQYELESASAQPSLRLFLRLILLWIALWAGFDVLLIWFWTARISGTTAHEYFGRWVLAWFFTHKVPLHSLTLPVGNDRYAIDALYGALNRQVYSGMSFGDWFAACEFWAALPATLLLLAAVYLVFREPEAQSKGRYLRGVKLVAPRRLSRELRRRLRGHRGIELCGVQVPRSLECEHFLVTGATGAGKSMAIRSLLRQIRARGDAAIIVDPECEYVSEFYQRKRGDLILNPVDERCPYWSPWLELSDEYYQADAATLAASLIPEPARNYESGSDHFFRQSSRTLLESLLTVASPREPRSIPRLLELPRDELKKALVGTPAFSLIDPRAHEQGAGIIATVTNATRPFLYLPLSEGRPKWSARQWPKDPEGWLFLTLRDDSSSAALPLANLWLDLLVGRLLNSDGHRRVWIVADELPVLRRQAKLESLVTRGRKRGLAAVLGFQSIAQLHRIYGHEQAAVLASMPSTKLLLRVDEPETAAFLARQIGEQKTIHNEIAVSAAERGHRFSTHPSRRTEPVVMASEIQRLPRLEGYLCIAGLDRARVRVRPCVAQEQQPEFIPRALPNPPVHNDSRHSTRLRLVHDSRTPTPLRPQD